MRRRGLIALIALFVLVSARLLTRRRPIANLPLLQPLTTHTRPAFFRPIWIRR